MKKLFGCILSLVMAVMLVFTPAEHVYAQGLGLSVSSSSVAVGKTVKVTVSMPSGYFGTPSPPLLSTPSSELEITTVPKYW